MKARRGLLLVALLVSSFAVIAQDAPFTVSPTSVTLLVNGEQTLTAPAGTTATGTTDNATASIDASLKIKAKAPGETKFKLENNGQSVEVAVRVIEIARVTVDGHQKPLVEGERRPITIVAQGKDDLAIPDVPFTFTSADPNVVRVEAGPVLFATATGLRNQTKTTDISVSVGSTALSIDGQAFKFPVTVVEPIVRIEVKKADVEITEGTSIDLRDHLKLHGKNKGIYEAGDRALVITGGNHFELSNNRLLTARDVPLGASAFSEFVTITSPEGQPGIPVPPAQLTVKVVLRASRLQITPELIPLARGGMTGVVTATLHTRQGAAQSSYDVTWNAGSFDDIIGAARLSHNTARIIWKKDPEPGRQLPPVIELTATTSAAGSVIDAKALLRILPSVAHFAPLRVRLNIMDDRTVADLFGEKTAQEFFVARVRLNNNLKKTEDGTELRGESILAFSESIEVAVAVEKRKAETRHWWRREKANDTWWPLTPGEVEWVASTGFQPRSHRPKPPESSSVPACKGLITYRPYTFEMIVNSGDPRYERTRRARTFRLLNGVGTLASFITSVAVPGPQSDIPLGLEKYSNLLIPGLQKLFPDIRDTQRQNIVSMTMKPIEEIPFGSDLSRVLFFPKGGFQGMLRGHETRISEICPHLFTIEVAVLDKSGKQQVTVDATEGAQ